MFNKNHLFHYELMSVCFIVAFGFVNMVWTSGPP